MTERSDKIAKASALLSLAASTINLGLAKRRLTATKLKRAADDANRAVELLDELTGERKPESDKGTS